MDEDRSNLVWHYTYDAFKDILTSGVLLPPRLVPHLYYGRGNELLAREKAVVADSKILLFSGNQVWEPTSYRYLERPDGSVLELHRLEDYAEVGLLVYRIGVPRGILKPWSILIRQARVPARMAQALANSARRLGSDPYDWYGSLIPVPRQQWASVQILTADGWQDYCVESGVRTNAGEAGTKCGRTT